MTVADIGLDNELAADVDVELMTDAWVAGHLPLRPLASHKGTFGRALVVAGSRNYVGAAHLAAMGAYRAGAGLVTLAVPESLCGPLATAAPEPTYLPLPETGPGILAPDAAPAAARRPSPGYRLPTNGLWPRHCRRRHGVWWKPFCTPGGTYHPRL